jgi:hypothetical protein
MLLLLTFTMLPLFQVIQYLAVEWLSNNELENIWNEVLIVKWLYNPTVGLEGLRKIGRNLGSDSRRPCRDSNRKPPEYSLIYYIYLTNHNKYTLIIIIN